MASKGTITATFVVGVLETPDSGQVTFRPYRNGRHVAVDDDQLTVEDVTVSLNAEGKISVELISTDNPDQVPSEWIYRVQFALGSGSRSSAYIIVPQNVETDLADATVAVVPEEGVYVRPGPPGPQGIQGGQGPQGPQGVTGATGATGAPGAANVVIVNNFSDVISPLPAGTLVFKAQ